MPGVTHMCSDAELRRTPLYTPVEAHRLALDSAAVERLIPHRPPMRLVDGIDAYDPLTAHVAGHVRTRRDDPVFTGHFPGDPVYPGVLLVEAMAQVALCAWALAAGASAPVRFLKIHHAVFIAPVGPGELVTLLARLGEDDGFTATTAAQAWRGNVLCAATIAEVYFV